MLAQVSHASGTFNPTPSTEKPLEHQSSPPGAPGTDIRSVPTPASHTVSHTGAGAFTPSPSTKNPLKRQSSPLVPLALVLMLFSLSVHTLVNAAGQRLLGAAAGSDIVEGKVCDTLCDFCMHRVWWVPAVLSAMYCCAYCARRESVQEWGVAAQGQAFPLTSMPCLSCTLLTESPRSTAGSLGQPATLSDFACARPSLTLPLNAESAGAGAGALGSGGRNSVPHGAERQAPGQQAAAVPLPGRHHDQAQEEVTLQTAFVFSCTK